MKQKEKQMITYNQDILELERRRIRAVQKVLDGVKQTKVAKEFKVTDGAISQWMSSYKENGWDGLKAISKSGRPVIFNTEHGEKIFEIISKKPYSWNYESDLWTVGMARDVLHEQTGTYFSQTRILSALHDLGFSFQKPDVKALEKKKTK